MSKIEWTDRTWNPVRGCSRVSEGCRNCYAERMAARFSGTKPPEVHIREREDPFHGFARMTPSGPCWTGRVELVPSKLDEPLRWRKPSRVFVNSMSDLFHKRLSLSETALVYGVMAAAPQHTFQVLTKRPEERRRFYEWLGTEEAWPYLGDALRNALEVTWPLPNVWEGVSCEDQQSADERIPLLLQTPAAVRFVSLEPLLGPIDLLGDAYGPGWLRGYHAEPGHDCRGDPEACARRCPVAEQTQNEKLDWVIVGGESGPGARPCDVAWIRSVVRQCREAGVACFVKQLGARPVSDEGSLRGKWIAGGIRDHGAPIEHPKGNDPSEWPEDLRVREWPE